MWIEKKIPKGIYSVKDLAKLLGLSERQIQNKVNEGQIPAKKIGSSFC